MTGLGNYYILIVSDYRLSSLFMKINNNRAEEIGIIIVKMLTYL